jgi:polyisoprenoid-binding protein YceI
MRNRNRNALIAVLALVPATVAFTSIADGVLELAPQSRLWINGTSSVKAFQCTAGLVEADVTTNAEGAISAVAGGGKAIAAVEVRIPATKLDCQNKTMNGHMFKALKTTAHPEIAFRVASYTLAKAAAGTQATLTGTLVIGGVEKPVTIVTSAKEEAGMLRVAGTHKVAMSDFGIKAPTLMMGTLKVGNDITVGFDLLLKN